MTNPDTTLDHPETGPPAPTPDLDTDPSGGGLEALEEDDDFDEFELHNWQPDEAAVEEEQIDWDEDWDSIEQEDDFAKRLADELRRNGYEVVLPAAAAGDGHR